jgi:putative ABC transport system permease protein
MRRPALLLVVLLVFALGIGGSTVIFSVVNGVLLSPLPYPESERLVNVWQTIPEWRETPPAPRLQAYWNRMWVSFPVYEDWLELNRVFESIGIFAGATYTATGGDRAEQITGTRVTFGVFDALGVRPMLGRAFNREEDRVGGPRMVVLSHGLWQRRFGADSAVVGRTMVLDESRYTIVGVMPEGFYFPAAGEMWTTFSDSDRQRHRFNQFAWGIARLKPGISLKRAQTEMEVLAVRMSEAHPSTYDYGVRLVSRKEDVVGDARPALLLLLGAVGVVLLIACANIANLLLVTATERRKELAVRSALGARRGRLLGQLLTESVALSVVGGGFGLWLAVWSIEPFVALLPAGTPRLADIALDIRVLAFSAVLSVLTGVLVGTLPALTAVRTQLTTVLNDSSRGFVGGRHRNRTQGVLLVSEIALTFVLLVGAGLLTRSLLHLTSVERGFVSGNVITLRLELSAARYTSDDRVRAFYQELYERLESIPGVQAVAAATQMPFSGGTTRNITTVEARAGLVETNVERANVSASYFRVMSIPLVAGRAFTPQDKYSDTPVAIVSQAMARTYWPDEEAVGRRIKEGGDAVFDDVVGVEGDWPWLTVVGVAGDVRHEGLDVEQQAKMYLPFRQGMTWQIDGDGQFVSSNRTVVLKTSIDPSGVMAAAREVVKAMDPDLPIIELSTLDRLISRSVAGPRFRTILIGSLAALATVLAVVGIFGVLAYAVARRTNEIGIRMALGAAGSDVVRGVLKRGMAQLATGLAIGLVVSLAAVQVLERFLFEISPTDLGTLIAVVVLLTSAALAASYIPARRATRVDPVDALRRE